MFGKRFELFRIFGFAVRADLSWLLLAVLVTWSLAVGVFPDMVPGLPTAAYWLMGVVGTVGLFLSIVLHELSHSLVARSHGVPMRGITLFIFGGVAEMDREPRGPGDEFKLAIAGPVASVVIGLTFLAIGALARALAWPADLHAVVYYLGFINLLLAGFNLVPAFPLDGGRVLRAALWHVKGDVMWATRLAAKIGAGFGAGMIFLGVVNVLYGHFIGGMWWFLIGLFLRGAAQDSHRQLVMRRTLEGEPVAHFMHADPVAVPRGLAVEDLVERFVYRHHHRMYPVVEGDTLVGCVSTLRIRDLPRAEWLNRTVGSIMTPCTADNTVGPDDDAMKALSTMSRTGISRLMVVQQGHLVGVLTLKDLLGLVSVRLELEPAA